MWPESGVPCSAAPSATWLADSSVGQWSGSWRVRPTSFQERTGPQLFAGGFGHAVGVLVGGVVAAPFVALLPGFIAWPLAALVVLVLAAASGTVFAARADDIAGLGRRTRNSPRPPRSTDRAFVVDSSAAIDGRALELARAGLISGDVWVPAFVVDELQSIADAADKDRRRRRRRLDVLEALRRPRTGVRRR